MCADFHFQIKKREKMKIIFIITICCLCVKTPINGKNENFFQKIDIF